MAEADGNVISFMCRIFGHKTKSWRDKKKKKKPRDKK